MGRTSTQRSGGFLATGAVDEKGGETHGREEAEE